MKVGARKMGPSKGEEEVCGRKKKRRNRLLSTSVPLVKRMIELALSATALTNTNKDKIRQ